MKPGTTQNCRDGYFASGDGQYVATASGFYRWGGKSEDRHGWIFIWQLPEIECRELVTPEENRWFEAVAWSPDGGTIAAGTCNGMVCFFDARSGDFVSEFLAHGAVITTVRFTVDGRYLMTASEDGSVGIWSISEADSKR